MYYQKYYQNELRFSGVYSRDNSPEKIKDGACETNLDISVLILELIGLLFMHWKIMLNNFEMFGIEYKSKILLMNLQLCKKILEYKHMIQQWADIFVLNLLILCVEVKA